MISEDAKAQMRAAVALYPQARSAMLPCLHIAQDAEGKITDEGIEAVAEAVGARRDEVESIATFYTMYHFVPQGQAVVKVCTSISCHLMGSDSLVAQLEAGLGVKRGETSADGRFTLECVECLAACGMAPALQVNGEFVERVGPERAQALIERLRTGGSLDALTSAWRLMTTGGYTAAPLPEEVADSPQMLSANQESTVPEAAVTATNTSTATTATNAKKPKRTPSAKNADKNTSSGTSTAEGR